MREIKFRAWDKKQKQWLNDVYIRLGGWASSMFDDDGGKNGLWEHDAGNHEDIELQQFTGLKDESGKEIYEGDVLRCGMVVDSATDFMGQIQKESFVVVEFKYGQWFGHSTLVYRNPYQDLYNLASQLEVIGNIYENHELLAGEQS